MSELIPIDGDEPSPTPRFVCEIVVRVHGADEEGGSEEDVARLVTRGVTYANAMDKGIGRLLKKLGATVKSAKP